MNTANYFLILLLSFLTAFLLIPVIIRYSRSKNTLDIPDNRKIHSIPVPRLGGVSFAISFIVIALIFYPSNNFILALIAGAAMILITGITDDLIHITPLLKFAGEILAAILLLYMGDIVITSFGDLLGQGEMTTGRYAFVVSVFCMVGVMNAINMIDGLDGLASGISIIGLFFLAWFAHVSGLDIYFTLLLILTGSLLGFLYYNKYPARIFMGDTGSLLVGYLLSALCIALVQPVNGVINVFPVSLAIVLGLPIVDAILVMVLRILRGRNPFKPDKTHLHDRLMQMGFNHPQAVLVIYMMMFSCGLLAVLLRHLPEYTQFATGVIYATLLFGSVYLLNSRDVKIR